MQLTVQENQYFTSVLTCSNLFKPFHTCPHLFRPVQTCSHLVTTVHPCSQLFKPFQTCSHLFKTVPTCSSLFTPVQAFSHLFTLVHTSSHLFTPFHTCSHLRDYTRSSQFLLEISPCLSCSFSILHAIMLKLHIFAHLIESYPTASGLSSCIEKKYQSLTAHATVVTYGRRSFRTFESSHSSNLPPILLKVHILTRLIESFPTLYGL